MKRNTQQINIHFE